MKQKKIKGIQKPRLPFHTKPNQVHKTKKDYKRKPKTNRDLDTLDY
jgi:hypothetical protein